MLKINADKDSFIVDKKKDRAIFYPNEFCLANFLEKYVFLVGGKDRRRFFPLNIVARYKIANDRWEYVSQLNISRYRASACSLGGSIYVIGG